MSSNGSISWFAQRPGELGNSNISNRKKVRRKAKWYKLRWLLPVLFCIGYLATYSKFEGFEIEYLALTFFSIIACCFLLTRLNPPLNKKLPIWIILAVFMVAYYLKFYWMVYDPEILGNGWTMKKLYSLIQYPTVLFETFTTISYAFITFCVTAWFLLGNTRSLHMEPLKKRINYRSVISILLWLIPVLMGVTTYVMYITGIGRMAADNPYLSFRLAGWVFHVRTTLIPALLLLLIWSSDKAGLRKYFAFGIILLFLHGMSDMLLRSSRGAILIPFILLTILFLVTGRINKKRVQLFGVILSITILLWPVISYYRYVRAADPTIALDHILVESIKNVSSTGSFSLSETFKEGVTSVIFRFIGADSLIQIMGANLAPLYTSAFGMSVTRFFTFNVVGFPPNAIQGCSPSFPGYFYLIGGNGLVVIAMASFVFLSWFCWCLLAKLKLRCLPVAQALFLWWIFSVFSSGVLDRLYLGILVMAGSIAACEWLLRTARSATVFKNSYISKSRKYADIE